jgi:ATP-binding cassette, subfamily B, bacterial
MNNLTKQTLKLFWQHVTKYPVKLGVVIFFSALTLVPDMIKPFFLKDFFNLLAQGTEHADKVLYLIFVMVGLSFMQQAFWRIVGFTNSRLEGRVMSDLLNTCYAYVQKHSNSFFDNNFVGSIVTKVRRFSRAYQSLADIFIYNLFRTILRIIIITGILIWYSPILGLMMIVWVVIYIGFSLWFAKFKLPYDTEKVKQDTKTTAHLADTITNHQNLKLFATYNRELDLFEKITDKLYQLRRKSWDLGQIQDTFQATAMTLLEAGVLFYAYYFWSRGEFSIGDFAFLQAYLMNLFSHMWDFAYYIRSTYEGIADANEMTEMLIKPHAIVDAKNAKHLKVTKGTIEFKDVKFEYITGKAILNNFNLSIAGGERVALVGQSGGGKSTIVKTLFRFVDLTSGSINIDGQNIAKVTQDSLREQISLVPQEPLLFHRSLLENIRYGKPDATVEEVVAASKAAHCHEFISGFEFGYDTLVGERGVKLSGGERQRVAIARAILRNAPILVLDEATSSLDSESESLIQDALKTLMQGKTTIVIAHRLSTIREMDRIIVIEDGKIIEQGKHEELVKAQQGIYQKLWNIQVGGFAANSSKA